MSIHFTGVGGAPGIAIGRAFCLQIAPPSASTAPANEPPEQALARFSAAQTAAAERLNAVAADQRNHGFEHEAGIFEFQAMLVEDPALTDTVTELVREQGYALDTALNAAIEQVRSSIAAIDDAYLSERAADIDAVGQEIRRALSGSESVLVHVPPGAIILAADLTPAETAELRGKTVAGFATAYGGPTGHTAILARALGIPAVVGLGATVLDITNATDLILDGNEHLLIADPTAAERAAYTQRAAQQRAEIEHRQQLRDQPGQTADGYRVALWANIGHPDEAKQARAQGAEGIGLFRTEFLFLDRTTAPSEQEQYNAYRATIETMAGRPVVVRTIDIGGDKPVAYLDLPREPNPFLGERALRLCMRQPDLFATQLRALLRAAVYGDLWIMLPMVATLEDLRWGRAQLQAAVAALAAEGVEHRADPPLGIMIETPAAAVTADLLAHEAAFFSIGSNDLTQYAMAADRGLGDLSARYPHDSTAVLRLIAQAAAAAQAANIPLGVCGELAGVPNIAPLLAGLGVAELSMSPASIPIVKAHLRTITIEQARAQAQAALLGGVLKTA